MATLPQNVNTFAEWPPFYGMEWKTFLERQHFYGREWQHPFRMGKHLWNGIATLLWYGKCCHSEKELPF